MTAKVKIKAVDFSFGSKVVLDNFNLEIRAGEYVCLIGASGIGKTTILRLIGGLEASDNGEVQLSTTDNSQSKVQFVFQDYDASLLPWISIKRNVTLACSIGTQKKKISQIAEDTLARVGLVDSAHKLPRQLSGGMQQRAAIARSLASQPNLLLMDEPFGALDTASKLKLQDSILDLWGTEGFTVIHVTHDLDEAVYMSDRIIHMKSHSVFSEYKNDLPRPRRRLETRESNDFLALRRQLFEDMGYLA